MGVFGKMKDMFTPFIDPTIEASDVEATAQVIAA